MALYLSATIRHCRQTSVIQHSIHNPPICLIKLWGGGTLQNHERVQKGDHSSICPWTRTCLCILSGKRNRNVMSASKSKQTGEKILYVQLLCIRKPGSRVMKLINKGALVCAARCCAAVPGCPWIFHEAESGEVCCLEHLVESTGTLVARKLQLQEGRRDKMPIKMKAGGAAISKPPHHMVDLFC